MFAYLFEKLCDLVQCGEDRRITQYLAESKDIAELERRERYIERNGTVGL